MHALKHVGRELTYEEQHRILSINRVIISLGHFLYLNDPATWPEDDVKELLNMQPREVRTFGGGAFSGFEVERID